MQQHTEPISLTVHNLPTTQQALPQQALQPPPAWAGRLKMLLVLLVCAAPVVASYLTYYVIRPSSGASAYSELIRPTRSLPDLTATRLDGQAMALRALKGQWLLVVVAGAECPAICERQLYLQRQLREMTGRERERIDKIWIVLDDAPLKPSLRDAVQASPGLQILRLPRALLSTWLQPASGQALEDHLYIVDPMGEWMMRSPAGADPSRLKRDLDRLLRASASWDLPGR